ncbi:hypothetical protein GDO81_017547 [Engystomops pustulosus]|uniref:Uncharacterized protein n=1 Tax=Engystomops pustulosus TaxID=76066 RepID=A0AAV7A7R9_ENGPU|nr:hypothetical protein GDO81_017547 [Engystomops pustulosus]
MFLIIVWRRRSGGGGFPSVGRGGGGGVLWQWTVPGEFLTFSVMYFTSSFLDRGPIAPLLRRLHNYRPTPPPPRSHISVVQSNESEEERNFRRLFTQLAGDDMEVSPTELMGILNKVVGRRDLYLDAAVQSDSTGKLGFEEFKYLWNNIKKWQLNGKLYQMIRLKSRRYSD